MESIIVKPKNKAQIKALKVLFEAMNVEYVLSDDFIEDHEDKALLKLMLAVEDNGKLPINNLYTEMGWK
jgi:hypothetical protein